jgi:hypothetical protein
MVGKDGARADVVRTCGGRLLRRRRTCILDMGPRTARPRSTEHPSDSARVHIKISD